MNNQIPDTINDMDTHSKFTIDGITYINMVSPETRLIKGIDNKPKIVGIKIGQIVSFYNNASRQEDKGSVYELSKNGVFVDNGTGLETYCSLKLNTITETLISVYLDHNY